MTILIEKIFVVFLAIIGFFTFFIALFHFFLYEFMDKMMLDGPFYFHLVAFVLGVILFFGSLRKLIFN